MQSEIDLDNEQVIAIREVPQFLPKRNGKRVHFQTVHRWTAKGTKGARLASVKIGGVRYTSVEALRRFCKAHRPDVQVGAHQDAIEAALSSLGLSD